MDSDAMSGADTRICYHCKERPATTCDECRRALALRSFWTISRHPEALEEGEPPCKMCGAGQRDLCGVCLVEQVHAYHTELLAEGHEIEEWPNIDAFGQRAKGQLLHSTGRSITERADQANDPAVQAVLREIGDQLMAQGAAMADPFGGI